MMDDGSWEDDDMMMAENPLLGNLTFTAVALAAFANASFRQFRYSDNKDVSAYDDVWGDYNWIDVYRKFVDYVTMFLMGIVTCTQIATLLGFGAYYNILAWGIGGMLAGWIHIILEGMLWYARDGANESDDGQADAAYAQVAADRTFYHAQHTIQAVTLGME